MLITRNKNSSLKAEKLPALVATTACIVVLTYSSSDLYWQLTAKEYTPPTLDTRAQHKTANSTNRSEKYNIDYSPATDGLFGQPVHTNNNIEKHIKVSNIKWGLSGVIAPSDNSNDAYAILRSPAGLDSVFSIGDEIEVDVFLEEILSNKVIINRKGERELISMPSAEEIIQMPPTLKHYDISEDSGATNQRSMLLKKAINELQKQPEGIGAFITLSDARKDKQFIGLQALPGSLPSLFVASGFEPMDIIVNCNGVTADDPQFKTKMLLEFTKQSNSIKFDILRNGKTVTLNVEY